MTAVPSPASTKHTPPATMGSIMNASHLEVKSMFGMEHSNDSRSKLMLTKLSESKMAALLLGHFSLNTRKLATVCMNVMQIPKNDVSTFMRTLINHTVPRPSTSTGTAMAMKRRNTVIAEALAL